MQTNNIFLKYINPVFIETGTYHGDGITMAIKAGFKQIISIENRKEFFDECSKRFIKEIGNKQVKLVFGNAEKCLGEIINNINENITFWLDAHPTTGCYDTGTFSIEKELETICKHKIKTHTILIDDVRIFNYFKTSKEKLNNIVTVNNCKYIASYETIRNELPNDVLVFQNWIKVLQNSGKKVYSQGKQDGYIEFIFKTIGTTNKFCVEFGFNSKEITGGSGPNTGRLVAEDKWDNLYLDRTCENLDINLHKEVLTSDNLGEIFKKYNVPKEPDFISIDVDSIDLWLFKSFLDNGYRPRLVSVEYNSNFPITISATMGKDAQWVGDAAYGGSLLALNRVANEFDYHLICIEKYLDLFFIRGDLILKEEIPKLDTFISFTNLKHHPAPSNERLGQFMEYPSLGPLVDSPWHKTKKYLLYKNIVHGAGAGHTLMCYNHAVQQSIEKKLELIVPKCIMGHNLGKDFEFEKFFGLDQYDNQHIDNLVKEKCDKIETMEYSNNGCFQNSDFSKTKEFFISRFLKTVDEKEKLYKNHMVSNKINIAIHIRRGDIVTKKSLERFETDKALDLKIIHDQWFKDSLDNIITFKKYKMEDICVNIYTELQPNGLYYNGYGESFDLKTIFNMPNCNFYYNGNFWECLYNMIKADVFIGATWGVPIIVTFFRDGLNRESYISKHINILNYKHAHRIGSRGELM